MRSDYFRMCYVLADGGFYVDADDVMTGGSWRTLYADDRLKLQPLCYDVPSDAMVPSLQIWRTDLPTESRIFYVNNNPLIAPAGHAVLCLALKRATTLLLGDDPRLEIQSTTVLPTRDCVNFKLARKLRVAMKKEALLVGIWPAASQRPF